MANDRQTNRAPSADDESDNRLISDSQQRKRIQNRLAQRTYREKLKRRIEALEQAAASSRDFRTNSSESTIDDNVSPSIGTVEENDQLLSPATSSASETQLGRQTEATMVTKIASNQAVNTYNMSVNDDSTPGFSSGRIENGNAMGWTPPLSNGVELALKEFNDFDTENAAFEAAFATTGPIFIEEEATKGALSGGIHDGKTALHLAAENGHHSSVWLLLDRLPDIHAQDRQGRTALHLATSNKHEPVVQALLARRTETSVDVQDSEGLTALHIASRDGQETLVDLLVKADANIELKNGEGRTALHSAVLGGHDKVIKLLLNNRANIDARIG